jgi:putative SOS response-associated peptidase YedK
MMCGRYTIVVTMEELMERYLTELPTNRYHTPRYNVAPMQQVPAIIHDGENNRLGELRWGLVPSWASDDRLGSKMINARAETLLEKNSFKALIRRKRAIIPADGFYEWKQTPSRSSRCE